MNFNNTKHDAVIADKQHNLELDSVYIIVSDCMGVFARVDELLYMKYKKKYCWKVFIFLRKKNRAHHSISVPGEKLLPDCRAPANIFSIYSFKPPNRHPLAIDERKRHFQHHVENRNNVLMLCCCCKNRKDIYSISQFIFSYITVYSPMNAFHRRETDLSGMSYKKLK